MSNIIKGLRSSEGTIENAYVINLQMYFKEKVTNYSDMMENIIIPEISEEIEKMRVYVRDANYLNDYENILIRRWDYIQFEQSLFNKGYNVISELFLGETQSTGLTEDLNNVFYKIKTNGSAILQIKPEFSEESLSLTMISQSFDSGSRVYRLETTVVSPQIVDGLFTE